MAVRLAGPLSFLKGIKSVAVSRLALALSIVAGSVLIASPVEACQACLQGIPACSLTQPYVISYLWTYLYASLGIVGGALWPLRWLLGRFRSSGLGGLTQRD